MVFHHYPYMEWPVSILPYMAFHHYPYMEWPVSILPYMVFHHYPYMEWYVSILPYMVFHHYPYMEWPVSILPYMVFSFHLSPEIILWRIPQRNSHFYSWLLTSVDPILVQCPSDRYYWYVFYRWVSQIKTWWSQPAQMHWQLPNHKIFSNINIYCHI
jgi:hypothetical protein